MLSRFSVRKPFVVVVAVIISLILGGVCLGKMKTDLLPQMDIPYLAVITTDPGATAAEVELEVTSVLEGPLASVGGVKTVQSQSSDNYSMIFLEFEDSTDVDAALVKVSSAVNGVMNQLPDGVGNPNYLQISMDLMATMYLNATMEGADIYQLSEFVTTTVVPEFERVDGVADVSATGVVERSVEVRLDDAKIAALDQKLADHVSAQFDEGFSAIADAESQIADAQAQIDAARADLETQEGQVAQAYGSRADAPEAYAQIDVASAQLDAQQTALDEQSSTLADQREELEKTRQEAVDAATIGAVVNKDTVASLISAQNLAMPAGYIDDGDDDQWMLRIGKGIADVDELGSMVLTNIEGIGDITVADVATITVVDNADASFVRLNQDPSVLIAIYKSSAANTSDVTNACLATMADLEDEYSDLDLYVSMDQMSFIDLFIQMIIRSLSIGIVLAVVVLAVFLRDVKPTVVVAFAIPFSVLVALLFMYFSGLTINILTLGGISLAVGMLVDNSIVVLENIYRLRGRGVEPARAAVQGARQISGAVVASTLTTICVFLPAIFTEGLVNQLLVPFALSITYVLVASLVVALTLVPSLSRYMFKNYRERPEGWFGSVKEAYASSLRFFLRHKALPILLALGLLGFSIWGIMNMGIAMIPNMTNKLITASITIPEGLERSEAYGLVEDVIDVVVDIDGVDYVGTTDGSSTISMVASTSQDSDVAPTMYAFYIMTDEDVTTEEQVLAITKELERKTRRLPVEIVTSSSDSSAMTSMLGSGLQITIKGPDHDELLEISRDVMDIVAEVDGYENIDNGLEDAPGEVTVVFDRNKLASDGLTSAQMYQALTALMDHDADSITLEVEGTDAKVVVFDSGADLDRADLLRTKVTLTTTAGESKEITLGDYASLEEGVASTTIERIDGVRVMNVTADVKDGENNALLSRELQQKLDDYDVPDGYSITFGGELENISTMITQMMLMALLGFILIYLIMVAQFQSLLSPFIVVFTVPLAFTGGFLGLLAMGEQLTLMSMMGFLVLMGTIVNNGIVFVDYVNQLRMGGLQKRDALVAAGQTRMRPILMTALTTILSMLPLVLSDQVGAGMERGMAVVVVGGLIYGTLMTLYVVPILYDLLYRRQPSVVDLGDEAIDDDPGDAAAFLEEFRRREEEAARKAAEEAAEQDGAVLNEAPALPEPPTFTVHKV